MYLARAKRHCAVRVYRSVKLCTSLCETICDARVFHRSGGAWFGLCHTKMGQEKICVPPLIVTAARGHKDACG